MEQQSAAWLISRQDESPRGSGMLSPVNISPDKLQISFGGELDAAEEPDLVWQLGGGEGLSTVSRCSCLIKRATV